MNGSADKAHSAGITASNCRPDYLVSVYDNGQEAYQSAVGEAKAESATKHSAQKDLYRIAFFTKDILDKSNMEAVIGFQSVGKYFPKKHSIIKALIIMS